LVYKTASGGIGASGPRHCSARGEFVEKRRVNVVFVIVVVFVIFVKDPAGSHIVLRMVKRIVAGLVAAMAAQGAMLGRWVQRSEIVADRNIPSW
jgi:hypothetical protein